MNANAETVSREILDLLSSGEISADLATPRVVSNHLGNPYLFDMALYTLLHTGKIVEKEIPTRSSYRIVLAISK